MRRSIVLSSFYRAELPELHRVDLVFGRLWAETPRQKGETELAVTETTIAGRRYVICRNKEEAKKDAAARAEIVAGLERKLAQVDKALVPTRASVVS